MCYIQYLSSSSAWKWPDIPGLHDFRGELYHTAAYDDTVDLKGKKVAVIGSGSSGVQVVASIYKDVDKLYHWIRSPIWVTAGYGSKYASENGDNFECKSKLLTTALLTHN